MAHCDVCCLRLSLNKDKTLPKHYTDSRSIWGGPQTACPGSGTTRYTPDRDRRWKCRRPLSKQTCTCCHRRPLTLNKNGKFPKHRALDGSRCSMSEANHPR